MSSQHGPSSPWGRARRTSAVLVAAAAIGLPLAGCGGGDDTASTGTAGEESPAGGQTDQADSFEEFQQCMADNGVDMGGQQGGGQPSVDQEALQRAQEACGDLVPEGGPGGQGGPGGPGGGLDLEAIQAWTDCLADNGVELELPGSAGPPSDGEAPTDGEAPQAPPEGEPPDDGSLFGLDTSDPEVAAAVEACQDLQPEMGGGPTGGSDESTSGSGEAA